jgi:FkbM family methyltransferase
LKEECTDDSSPSAGAAWFGLIFAALIIFIMTNRQPSMAGAGYSPKACCLLTGVMIGMTETLSRDQIVYNLPHANSKRTRMSGYNLIKWLARAMHMYRPARWVRRHVLRRGELHTVKKELAFFANLIRPGTLCFDVGANYGDKSEVFLGSGARVVAFEPQIDCLTELRDRLGPHPRLTTVNAAIGSKPGRSTLYIDRHRTSTSLLGDWQPDVVSTTDVQVTTLDCAIAQYGRPDYCKIDVEGYELEVLKGLSQPIPLLSFEYHLQRDGVQAMIECLNYLSGFGEIEINITPAETPEFGLSCWLKKSPFLDHFSAHISSMSSYCYGDIFVKTIVR